MEQSLFRHEAIDFQSQANHGGVVLIRPLSFSLITAIAVLITSIIITFMLWGEYTRKAKVKGYLAPTEGLVKVYTPEVGTLVEIFVDEGQKVKQGDQLFVLSTERSTLETKQSLAESIALIKRRRDNLTETLVKQSEIGRITSKKLDTRLQGLTTELDQIGFEFHSQSQRLSSSKTMAKRYQDLLSKKFVSAVQAQEKEDLILEQKANLHALQRERLGLEREIATLGLEMESNKLEAENKKAEIKRNISTLEQELTEHMSRRDILITAPKDGTVTTILIQQGQTANPSKPLLSILPQGAILEAKLLVPSRSIGFIKPNQSVELRYHAFPYQRFGSYKGTVDEISKTLITPNETQLPITLEEPVYRIGVRLNAQAIKAYNEKISLKSGMLLDADIRLDHQRIIDWVFDPLYSLAGRV